MTGTSKETIRQCVFGRGRRISRIEAPRQLDVGRAAAQTRPYTGRKTRYLLCDCGPIVGPRHKMLSRCKSAAACHDRAETFRPCSPVESTARVDLRFGTILFSHSAIGPATIRNSGCARGMAML